MKEDEKNEEFIEINDPNAEIEEKNPVFSALDNKYYSPSK
jgi:hypothetical protein